MGMGYASAHADCVEQKFVEENCPKEFQAFIKAIDDPESDVDFDFVAKQLNFEPAEEVPEPIVTAYKKLCEVFERKTGLVLGLGFHDQHDEGDRYDDVDGAYWYVGGVYRLSVAGEKYEDHITRKNFVQYG